jgi:HAD superfamily hydrolase (TIGR01549 family)
MNLPTLPTHWIFDLDGTLVDSFSGYFDTLRGLFTRFNKPYTEEDIWKSLTMHSSKYLPLYFDNTQTAYAAREIQESSEARSHEVKAFEGIEEALLHLRGLGVKMAIWTGRDRASAMMILQNTGLNRFFDHCVGGTCVVHHKPHPEGLLSIINKWGCDKSSVVMVGDHDVDMVGARDENIFSVRVSWAHPTPPNCQLAHQHFHQVRDFRNWLAELTTFKN